MQGGRLRALAVSSAQRMPTLPNVPTVAEAALPGFELVEWIGLWAPNGTPDAMLDRLASVSRQALERPDVRERLAALGMQPAYLPRPDFARFVPAQRTLMTRIATDAGIQPE